MNSLTHTEKCAGKMDNGPGFSIKIGLFFLSHNQFEAEKHSLIPVEQQHHYSRSHGRLEGESVILLFPGRSILSL